MDFGLLDLGDDVAEKEEENDTNPVEEDLDDQQSVADEAQSLVSTVETFPQMILAARQMDAVMSKYVDKKSKFDLLSELEGLEAMVIKSVGRDDVKTVNDLILLLENPFKVTAKDVSTTTTGLRRARTKLIQISGKLGKVESKIAKKSKKQNIKKMKDTLQPNTTIASKIGGKFTDVTSSIVGSIVGAVSTPFITPVGGAAAGYATKKGLQMGAKKGASKLRDKKLV